MLHILWMMIKFILFILGILLGLILLAVLLILFCPVRYQAQAEKTRETPLKEASVAVRVSWLFRGVSLKITLEKGKSDLVVRILGIPVNRVIAYVKNRKKKVLKSESPQNPSEVGVVKEGKMEDFHESGKLSVEENTEKISNDSTAERDVYRAESEESGLFLEIMGKIKSMIAALLGTVKKILSFPKVFTDKIRKITLTIRSFCGKMDWWKKFLSHPRVKEAWSFVWTDIKKLICHILPTRMEGQVTFGTEDPSITGAVLAALGISFPLHKNCVAVTPLFDGENVLEGSIRLKGRIYGCIFIKTAIQTYFNKNVKYVIRRWKRKEG